MADTHPKVTADIHPKAAMEAILHREATADTHLKDTRRSHRRRADLVGLVRQVVQRLGLGGV